MEKQGDLFFDRSDLRFQAYHLAHPEVYDLFCNYALSMIERGFKHYGAKSVMERIRWHMEVDMKYDGFKVNNNYTSRYSRMFCVDYPRYASFFRIRSLKG